MSIQEGYGNNERTVSFDTKGMLDNKIDKLNSKMKQIVNFRVVIKINHLSLRFIKEEREDKVEIIIMIEAGSGMGMTKLVVGIKKIKLQRYDLNMDKTIEKGLNIVRIIEVRNLRRGNYSGAQNYIGQTFRREYRGNYGK